MKKTNFISLRTKVIGLCVLLVLFCTISLGGYFYLTLPDMIMDTASENYINILESIIETIDIVEIEGLKSPEDVNSAFYMDFTDNLENLKNSLGFKDLYFMKKISADQYIRVSGGVDALSGASASLLVDENGSSVISPAMQKSFDGEYFYELAKDSQWGEMLSLYAPIKNQEGTTIGIVGANLEAKKIFSRFDAAKNNVLLLFSIVLLIGVTAGVIFAMFLIRSLVRLQKQVEEMQKGDFTIDISYKSNDEIGKLAQSIGILTGNFSSIISRIRKKSEDLSGFAANLSSSSNQIASASQETSNVIGNIAYGSREQARELSDIIVSLDDFNRAVQNIFTSLDAVNENTNLTSRLSGDGNNRLSALNRSIRDAMEVFEVVFHNVNTLNINIKQIDEMNTAIQALSEQTNLLSLNAAIEAARAGENGKGFAVVAEEIRKLAEQSRQSTNHITSMIETILTSVSNVVSTSNDLKERLSGQIQIVDETNKSFDGILKSVDGVIPKLKRTYDDADRIVKNKDAIIKKMQAVSSVSAETAISAEQISASSEEMSATTQEVASVAQHLDKASEELFSEFSIFNL